ncbi:hypothetical protein [Hymenobacter sp. UYCo722]|uniref:hypothetical protein n=1 Tax=Hymenobacter sp. UYCo722 TaxID=3156335 RepID=UPI00339A1531
MTRATLLHVLERPTALGPAEVRELEQLAQAFPYCQTAHLLLAKAAHDQGTMLAGQRLRRAATYAADRTLLRRLIEQEDDVPAAAAPPEPAALPAAPHPLDLVDWPDEYVAPTAAPVLPAPVPAAVAASAASAALLPVTPPLLPAPTAPAHAVAEAFEAATETATTTVTPTLSELVALPETAPAPHSEPQLVPVAPPALAAPAELPTAAITAVVELIETPVIAPTPMTTGPAETAVAAVPEAAAPTAPAVSEIASPAPAAVVEPASETVSAVSIPVVAETPATVEVALPPAAPIAPEALTAAPAPAPAIEELEAELPAQAPAIRPPVEVGEARFEFGLADPAPVAALPTYELPGLVDEWAASAVTRGLGSPDAFVLAIPVPVVPVFTPAAFTGDAVVGYALGESSRLGLSMQLLDLLTARAEAVESSTALVAAAQPPASALPPTGTFFEPDPLLLGHWATHRPAAPELPSTVDLINNFLKRQPRLTRPAMLPPAATHQADLSVRSTRAEPDLVSENLARIFVRQGKTARAIEIYEKLMVKQPEKMAYFALQIQSLQPSA